MIHNRRSSYPCGPSVRFLLMVGLLLVFCFQVGQGQWTSQEDKSDVLSRERVSKRADSKRNSRQTHYELGLFAVAEAAPSNPSEESTQGEADSGTESTAGYTVGALSLPLFLFLLLGLTLGVLVLVRTRRMRNEGWEDLTSPQTIAPPSKVTDRRKSERREKPGRRASDRTPAVPTAETGGAGAAYGDLASKAKGGTGTPPQSFGAFRVEQEVGKLVLGHPYRMDVMTSRAGDDRRAIEASLIKGINSPDVDADGRTRARTALEEYGFVARQCAALLLAHSAYERTSAARVLGEFGSAAALPFLLEALYDNEETVRVQALTSLGSLRLPSAIGALLDVARNHPDMPAELISRALSACTVDCFDGPGAPIGRDLPAFDGVSSFSGEITGLETPFLAEVLAETDDSELLADLLVQLTDESPDLRAIAARSLGEFRFTAVIERLAEVSASDMETTVRAAAVTALATIDHELAFLPVLTALVDEAREVRAAAARALSSLNIDRADAYARVAMESPIEVKKTVARACVKAGLARQAIERLAGEDRRQAYEAYALLVILAQSGEIDVLLEAMGQDEDKQKAVCAARVMSFGGQPECLPRLRQLAVRSSITEDVRTEILEVIYKIDQAQLASPDNFRQ